LIIEPENSTWTEDAGQHASATVDPGTPRVPADDFRDFAVVFQKGLNLRYGTDGTAVENIAGEGGAIPEDSHDAGQKAINYGTEPAWYRFGLRANTPFGGGPSQLGAVGNAYELYSNSRAGGQDPATPVFTATAGQPFRMRVLEPTGVGRGSTFDLQGHLWQRDPYLDGTTPTGGVPSQTIGDNSDAMYLGHQESVTPAAHFDIVLPSAGGTNGVLGDYLFRDHGSFGNTDGLWGILRVAATLPAAPPLVTITNPADGSFFTVVEVILFEGTAEDADDGDLSGSLVWESDIDGVLSPGGASFTTTLSVGTHTITASATDSDGLTGSDSITVTVVAADEITVETAVFRNNNGRWDVRGTAVSGAVITVTHDQTAAIVGSDTAVDGAWRISGRPDDPAAVADPADATITVESSSGSIVENFPVDVR
jgi:hypothetical protein